MLEQVGLADATRRKLVSRMIAVVRSELAKIVTQPTVWLVTGILVALHVLVQYQGSALFRRAMSSIAPDGTIEIFVGRTEPAAPALIELLVAGSLQICLFVLVLGAVTITLVALEITLLLNTTLGFLHAAGSPRTR